MSLLERVALVVFGLDVALACGSFLGWIETRRHRWRR